MQPIRDAWAWTKKKAKEHPRLTGAAVAAGAVVAVVGTGPIGVVVAITAASAGASVGGAIATDPGKTEEKKKEEDKKDTNV